MAFRNRHILMTMAIVGISTLANAQDLRGRIAQLEKANQSQEQLIETTRIDLTEKTREIDKIKSGQSGIVSKFLLQKKLREAQIVSKDLESLMRKQTKLNASLRAERSNLMNDIDSQIKTLTAGKDPHQLAQLQQLQLLVTEKERLMTLQQRTVLQIPNFNLSSAGTSREDLVEKLHVVEDLQKSINQKIAYLKEEISEEKSKEFLRSEMSHFIDEENFFGEQSFMSSGLNRRENSRNPALTAMKRENNADTSVPTADPAQPSTTPDTGSTTGSTTPEVQPVTVAQPTSESTSFQQPQELNMFETLLDQVQGTIRDTNPKLTGSKSKADVAPAKSGDKKISKKNKRAVLEQNLALSQKIMSDLDVLRQNLNHQIQSLE